MNTQSPQEQNPAVPITDIKAVTKQAQGVIDWLDAENNKGKHSIVKTHCYRDYNTEKIIYLNLRQDPKRFNPCYFDGEKARLKMPVEYKDKRLLYVAGGKPSAVRTAKTIIICEGEKDATALYKKVGEAYAIVALSGTGIANKIDLSIIMQGAGVLMLPHNDAVNKKGVIAGVVLMESVAYRLRTERGIDDIRIMPVDAYDSDSDKGGYDVADYLADGKDPMKLIDACQPYKMQNADKPLPQSQKATQQAKNGTGNNVIDSINVITIDRVLSECGGVIKSKQANSEGYACKCPIHNEKNIADA